MKMQEKKEIVLVLYDIRSAYNVGAIFRTADAAGILKIYLTGITAKPIDRFGRKRSDIHKAALGAENFIQWEYDKDALSRIKKLKKEGFFIVAIEQSLRSVDYKKLKPHKKTVFIFGNEVSGLPSKILAQCDTIAEIHMRGEKESLNVSVSAGVLLFRVLNI